MSELLKVRSLSDTDTSVYEVDEQTAEWISLEWGLHYLLSPDIEFRYEVIIKEDGESKVYAICNRRHAGWGLTIEFPKLLPPLWLEFIRSAS